MKRVFGICASRLGGWTFSTRGGQSAKRLVRNGRISCLGHDAGWVRKFVVAAVLALVFQGATMANVEITASNSASSSTTTASFTLDGSTGSPNLILAEVMISIPAGNATVSASGITWSCGSKSLTMVGSAVANTDVRTYLYSLQSFTAGSCTVSATVSTTTRWVLGAVAFSGVSSFGNNVTAVPTTATGTVTATLAGTGGLEFAAMGLYATPYETTTQPTVTSPAVQVWDNSKSTSSGGYSFFGEGVALDGAATSGAISSTAPSDTTGGYHWAISAVTLTPLSSTAVRVSSLTATPSGGGNVIKLQTGREVNNLGFNFYREQNGQRVKLNSSLLAGSALLGGADTTFTAGHIRTWQDDLAAGSGQVAYWVEEIDLSGASKWYGPAIPDSAGRSGLREAATRDALRGAAPTSDRAVSLSSIGRSPTVSDPVSAVAAAAAATPQNIQTQWSLAAGQAVKLGVSSEGWYRVTQPQLVTAGLNPNINPNSLQLYANGAQQPILVENAVRGRFGPQDAIDFYGLGLNTIWSGTQEYWLVAGNGTGLRIGSEGTSNGPAGATSFPFTIQWQPRTVYFAALPNGNANANSFFGPVLDSTDPLSQALTVTHLNAGAGGTLQVTLQGGTAGPHAVTVTLNGQFVGNMAFRDFNNSACSFPVPNSYLKEGANTLGLAVAGGATDVSLVDTVLLTYPHSYIADNNSLRLTAASGRKVTVSGFSGTAIQVIDITNPLSVSLVPASVSAGAVSFVPAGGGTRTLLAVASSQFATPESITANHPSSWHSAQAGGDLVIVSHASLLAAVAPLASLRQSQGHKVQVIDVEDLYDEFNFGEESPYAIQSFLSAAKANWTTKPAYVLLMGNGTFDPRNYLGTTVPDLVPVKLVDTSLIETASDDWFADFNNDGIPEMAIGRIPAETAADAAIAVNRLIAYDQSGSGSGWKNQALLVAGVDEDPTDNFESFTAVVKALLPGYVTATQVLAGKDPLGPADVLSGLNAGASLVNYVGHGSDEVWADGLLSSEEVAGLTNGNAAPLVLSMTCLNGYFQDVYSYALAKALLNAPDGGAVAVWASSGLTDASPQSNIDQAMVKALYAASGTTIGQAARAAKAATTDMDVRRTWILFGDPAMKLQ
jgi:hypothetical protein